MYCNNCGTKLEEGATFCHNCGINQNGQPNVGNIQTGFPNHTVHPKRLKKKNIVLGVAATALIAVAASAGSHMLFGDKELNLEKFDKENKNVISTSWFKEFASNEEEFRRYEISGNTEENETFGHEVLNQQAVDIDNHDPIDGIYLSIYEDKEALERYAYEDIIKIIGKDVNMRLKKAIQSSSGDFYYIEFCDGMFGNHSYCFYLRGNSIVYAIQCLDSVKSAYDYLLEKDETGMFGIPVYTQESNDLIIFSEQFLEDYNNILQKT